MMYEYLYNATYESQDGRLFHVDYLKIPLPPTNEMTTYTFLEALWQQLNQSSWLYRSVFGFTTNGNAVHVTRRGATLVRHYDIDNNGKLNV